jgi:hypothetical protein
MLVALHLQPPEIETSDLTASGAAPCALGHRVIRLALPWLDQRLLASSVSGGQQDQFESDGRA